METEIFAYPGEGKWLEFWLMFIINFLLMFIFFFNRSLYILPYATRRLFIFFPLQHLLLLVHLLSVSQKRKFNSLCCIHGLGCLHWVVSVPIEVLSVHFSCSFALCRWLLLDRLLCYYIHYIIYYTYYIIRNTVILLPWLGQQVLCFQLLTVALNVEFLLSLNFCSAFEWDLGPEHTGHFVQPHVAAHCGGDIYLFIFKLWRAHCSLWLKCATGCGSSPPQTERLHT